MLYEVITLGTGYDYTHRTTLVAAEARRGRRGVAVDFRLSDFDNQLDSMADRTGRVVSARVSNAAPEIM